MRRLGGRFALERKIGSGGMSVILLGKDEVLDRPVAVKVLKGGFEDSEVGARFRREGRTAARLSHPNIVQVYDAGEDELDGREVYYIVMEYVSGGDLKGLIDAKGDTEGPLAEKELARIGGDVASGLAYAHEKGIIHRDIKPQNILIDEYGRPKLGDFGIARALDATPATQTGSYLGTASYSSPEQLRGREITPKSDVYSLGCTLYEAATREPPFSGGSIEVANQQLTKLPAPPRTRGADLSEPFEALILACLAKDPVDRPDAAGLQERLLRLSAMTSGAVRPAPSLGETTRNLAEAAGVGGIASGAAKGIETVAQGLRNRSNSAGASERTVVEPARTSHQTFGRNRRPAFAAGAVALLLLALVAVVGTLSLLNLGSGETEQPRETAESSAKDTAAEAATAEVEITTAPVASAPAPPPSKAEEAVYDLYIKNSYRNVDASWAHLSQRLKNEVGSKENWAQREQLSILWDVYFVQMPSAELSGNDTARVAFRVREFRTGGAKLVTGTWECVNEGGEWKLDRFVEGNA